VQVYFTWVIRDFGSAEWFHSLLHAIEEQDVENRIEINIYLTAKIKEDDMNNIVVQDVGADKDAITSLRAPTHFGRPNWDRVFPSIAEKHPETDVGVFFCGPPVLSRQLHQMSNRYSTPGGTRFFFGKGALFFSTELTSLTLVPREFLEWYRRYGRHRYLSQLLSERRITNSLKIFMFLLLILYRRILCVRISLGRLHYVCLGTSLDGWCL
jgi:Ferric reductase NAD binding domain